MDHAHRIIRGSLFGFCLLLCLAFTHLPRTSQAPIYDDDFKRYNSDRDLQKSYQVWPDGARINVLLYEGSTNPHGKAMRVEVVAPNPVNNAMNGSFYHYLSARDRNWSGSTGVRFWVKNVSDQPLLLSINFKEKFNEYWAVAESGIFFLESEVNQFQKVEIEYGNLPIPAEYSGYVMVPFISFAVPNWNTALGDEVMDLSGIETLAFGVTIAKEFPHIFLMDDIALISRSNYPYLEIKGSDHIQSPASGEHREAYTAYLVDPLAGTTDMVSVDWALMGANDLPIALDEQGWLTIPAGLTEGVFTLQARTETLHGSLIDTFQVFLGDSSSGTEEEDEMEKPGSPVVQPRELSDYERFSQDFENWATENRPIFVMMALGVVLLVLWVLSSFQKKIK